MIDPMKAIDGHFLFKPEDACRMGQRDPGAWLRRLLTFSGRTVTIGRRIGLSGYGLDC